MERLVDFQTAVDQFSDWRWRLNNLYYITDKEGRKVLFKTNWAQESFFDEMHHLNLILKARQLGFTTFIQIFMLDACVFNSNVRAGTIAHTLGDVQTIFRDKIRLPYDNLPDQIKDAVHPIRDSANELALSNNSSIRVGVSMRSGTLQYLHISEFGKICAKYPDKAREIVTGALNTIQAGQWAAIESTAEGKEGPFYDMCQRAQTAQRLGSEMTPLDWKFHFYPWWKHGEYQIDPARVIIPGHLDEHFAKLEAQGITLTPGQKAWYAKKYEDQQEDMKREFPSTPEEAFEAAVEGAYYANQLALAERDKRITSVPHEPTVPVETWWDLGMDDCTSIWFVQRVGLEIRVIRHYANSGEGLAHYARELDRYPYRYSRHVLPHDAEVRELGTGKSRKEVLQSLGLNNIEVVPALEVADGIEAVRNTLPKCWFDQVNCEAGLKSLKAYRKEWDDKAGTWKNRPRHDWASHDADAFRVGAVARVIEESKEVTVQHLGEGGWMA
jgi:hypothetical protein